MEDLGTPKADLADRDALAINSSGTIVGDASGSSAPPVAWVLGSDGAMLLLNSLIDPSLDWDIMVASGIDDSGQIVGYPAFLMTPMVTVTRTLTGITVTPASAALPKGSTQQYTATGAYSDGSTSDLTGTVAWSSSKPKVAGIAAGGLLTALKAATTTVTATDGSVSGSTTAKIGLAQLTSIAITPTGTSAPPGSTVQFSGTGRYPDGSTKDLTSSGSLEVLSHQDRHGRGPHRPRHGEKGRVRDHHLQIPFALRHRHAHRPGRGLGLTGQRREGRPHRH